VSTLDEKLENERGRDGPARCRLEHLEQRFGIRELTGDPKAPEVYRLTVAVTGVVEVWVLDGKIKNQSWYHLSTDES
jgi:hypothetical protein